MNSERSNTQLAPTFMAGDLALDFLNSVDTSGETALDFLASGENILAWLIQAKLLEPAHAAAIRANSLPGEIDAVAVQARALREWFRKFVLSHMGHPLSAPAFDSLQPLNSLLQRDQKYLAIVEAPQPTRKDKGRSRLELRSLRHGAQPNTLILIVAQVMADLICSKDFSMVKARNDRTPALLFFDAQPKPTVGAGSHDKAIATSPQLRPASRRS
jgi:predicted RNA-binding Zn ribbon-like protein